MTDLRKAAEMALEALEDSMYPQKKQFDAIVGLKQALAQPEPVQVSTHEFIAMASKQANMIGKPVVWAEYPTPHKIILDEGWEWGHEARAKEALAQPEQESISTNDHLCAMLRQVHDVLACTALPMKRKWVGLTINEVWDVYEEDNYDAVRFARAIEAKLKEKNHG